jgi:DNA invertase Pin-like site-specific DNA recombinase
MKMQIGYMRVSKADGAQMLDLQKDALIAAGVNLVHIYEDQCSGAKDDRPGLTACLKALRNGDQLVIWRLDRLGRNMKHLVATVEDMNSRGIAFKCLTGLEVDTATPTGRFMLTVFAGLAQMERDIIRERTIAGLAAARARGRKGGRRSVFTKSKLRQAQAALKSRDTGIAELCDELRVSKSTLYRNLTPDGALTVHGEKLLGIVANGNGK